VSQVFNFRFFINHLSPSPEDSKSTISNIYQKFSQILVVATPGASSLLTTLVVNGENVKYRKLFTFYLDTIR
jgi:hypothetical protein